MFFNWRKLFFRDEKRYPSVIQLSVNRRLEEAVEKKKQVFFVYVDVVRLRDLEHEHGEKFITELLVDITDCIYKTAEYHFRDEELLKVEHIWGDDFGICFSPKESYVSPSYLEEKLARFQARLEYEANSRELDPDVGPIKFHIGYAPLNMRHQQLEKQLYHAMKEAMKWAKQNDGSRISKRAHEFRDIIQNRKITALFQPIVSLKTGEIYGWESLARGPKDSYFYSPLKLFSFAEEIGELFRLEKLCREQALESASGLTGGKKLFLNMNPGSIDDPAFVKGKTASMLEDYGISPDDLVFEITERHAISDFTQFRKSLENYRTQGYMIAIDDMGAGYSNLQTVVELAPDFLKLDISLISGIDRSRIKQHLLESIVTLAGKIHCKLIAEGIETEAELKTLMRLGIEYGQGYFIARPREDMPNVSAPAREILRREVAYQKKKMNANAKETVQEIAEPAVRVKPETTALEVQKIFQQDMELSSVLVESGGKLLGIVMRQHFFQHLSLQYGVPLFYHRPITKVMDRSPLCFQKDELIDTASEKAMHRGNQRLYDDMVVLDGREILGVITVKSIVEKVTEIKLQMAKYANPLTGLPGNVRIDDELKRRLEQNETFAVIYCDLNHFKKFNDQYGFEMGDKMITFTARFFQSMLKRYGAPNDFLGHIGGDDFIIISAPENAERLGKNSVRLFQKIMRILHRNTGVNVTVSLACIICSKSWFESHLQISENVAAVKKKAKEKGENVFLIDDHFHKLKEDEEGEPNG